MTDPTNIQKLNFCLTINIQYRIITQDIHLYRTYIGTSYKYIFDLNLNYLSFAFFRLFIINLCDFFWAVILELN